MQQAKRMNTNYHRQTSAQWYAESALIRYLSSSAFVILSYCKLRIVSHSYLHPDGMHMAQLELYCSRFATCPPYKIDMRQELNLEPLVVFANDGPPPNVATLSEEGYRKLPLDCTKVVSEKKTLMMFVLGGVS